MLRTRQLIPPLTMHAADGRTVRASDFKQKKNLVIAFFDAGCALCDEFLRRLEVCGPAFREKEAAALVVFLEASALSLTDTLPKDIVAGSDVSGRAARAYLGDDAFAARGLTRTGVFIADRYGELFAQWVTARHEFPPASEILSCLDQIEISCEGCSVAEWPADS